MGVPVQSSPVQSSQVYNWLSQVSNTNAIEEYLQCDEFLLPTPDPVITHTVPPTYSTSDKKSDKGKENIKGRADSQTRISISIFFPPSQLLSPCLHCIMILHGVMYI